MKELIIEVPDGFGKKLQPEKVNSEIKGELIRCEACAHFKKDNIPEEGCGYCNLFERTFYSDDYCSQAVKMG